MSASSGAQTALSQPAASPSAASQTTRGERDREPGDRRGGWSRKGRRRPSTGCGASPTTSPSSPWRCTPTQGRPPRRVLPGRQPDPDDERRLRDDPGRQRRARSWYDAMPAWTSARRTSTRSSAAPCPLMPYSATVAASFEVHQLAAKSKTVVAPTGYATDVHELRVLPNGNYLVLSYPLKSCVDLTGLSIAGTGDAGSPDPGNGLHDPGPAPSWSSSRPGTVVSHLARERTTSTLLRIRHCR